MNLTGNRNRAPKKTGISFPLLECWNPVTHDATFVAQVDGRRVMCRISLDLLKKVFNSPKGEPLPMVVKNRSTLEAVAREMIKKEAFENDGSIHIRESDFQPAIRESDIQPA